MRRGAVWLLAFGAFGTIASNAWGQDPAASASVPAPTSVAPAAAPAVTPTPAPTDSTAAAPPKKYQLGLRVGFSDPFGNIASGFNGSLPIWLDFGYRVSPQIVIGVYAQYGVLFVQSGDQGYDLHFGGEVHYHFAPIKGLDPWVGAGVGYELAGDPTAGGGSLGGFEFFSAQAGLDYEPGFGPFVAFSLDDLSSSGGQSSMNQWLTLGVRGVYDL